MSRNALVTGAAQGIGRAIALRLARDGLNVAVNDLDSKSTKLEDTQKQIEKLGRKSTSIVADISNEKAVESMMQNAAKQLGSLDVVIANAGIAQIKSMLEMTAEEWDKTMAINLRGVFLCYREAAKIMIEQGKGGKLIAACSIAAYKPIPMIPHYCTSKWGIRGLTQAAAIELAQHKITVNAYCPGYVGTSMIDDGMEQIAKANNCSKEDVLKMHEQAILFGHLAKPDDIANFVSYLTSKDSDYMTGQSIVVDGGALLT